MLSFSWQRMFDAKNYGNRQRVILHCDLNNFFASVACLQDPNLRGKNFAVCGNPELRKGIVLAKSQSAKKLGVKTGMAIWEAQQVCPDLVVVGPDYQSYASYSKKVQAIYYRFTNQVESFGIDECWLDVTHSQKLFGSGPEIAAKIRQAVKQELGLTISVGVSFNKTFAKLGSDLAEPDATVVITNDNYQEILYPLPLGNLLFIGKKTQALLQKLNVKTIGNLANYDVPTLQNFLGINAVKLVAAARGDDYSVVNDYDHHEPPKSVGNGTTLPYDLTTKAEVEQVLYLLSEQVAYRLRAQHLQGYTVSLAVKNTALDWCGMQTSLPYPTCAVLTLRETASTLFDQLWATRPFQPVRALRIAVSQLTNISPSQLDFFDAANTEMRHQALDVALDKVRRKYGTAQIMFGGTPQSYAKLGFHLQMYDCDEK